MLAMLVMAGCSGPADQPGSAESGADATASTGEATEAFGADLVRAQLLEADRAFASATDENRIGGWMSHFSSRSMMVSGSRMYAGEEAIRALMAPAFADSTYRLSWEPTFAAVSESEDLGYTVGRYESRRKDSAGEEVVEEGSYLTVWRRRSDGRWMVEADIGSSEGN
jgi:ketosteroid isomerase-like protein